MKNLYLRLGILALVMALATLAFAAPKLLPDPGVSNGNVQTMAPVESYSRTYTNGTKTMACYSTQSAGVPSRIIVEFDARQVGTTTAVAGKFSMNRSTKNYAVKSTDLKAVDSGTTSYCFTPMSSATQVQSSWRGM